MPPVLVRVLPLWCSGQYAPVLVCVLPVWCSSQYAPVLVCVLPVWCSGQYAPVLVRVLPVWCSSQYAPSASVCAARVMASHLIKHFRLHDVEVREGEHGAIPLSWKLSRRTTCIHPLEPFFVYSSCSWIHVLAWIQQVEVHWCICMPANTDLSPTYKGANRHCMHN